MCVGLWVRSAVPRVRDLGAIDTHPDPRGQRVSLVPGLTKKRRRDAPGRCANTNLGRDSHLRAQEETVEKSIGRHRKRRRGWGEHVRWMLGAVLTAMFCGPASRTVPPRPEPEARRPRPDRRARPDWEATSGPPVGGKPRAASRTHTESGTGGDVAVVPSQRNPYPGRRGWCVDDDGVCGVRPYLARAEERYLRGHTETTVGAGHGDLLAAVHEPAPVPAPVPEGGGAGEFAELARLVRDWQAMTT